MTLRSTRDGLVALGSPVSVRFHAHEYPGCPSLSAVLLGTRRQRSVVACGEWENALDDVIERLVWEARDDLRPAPRSGSPYR